MSRTKKGKKPIGYDYWSKRAGGKCNNGFGPEVKRQTHRLERIEGKKAVKAGRDEE